MKEKSVFLENKFPNNFIDFLNPILRCNSKRKTRLGGIISIKRAISESEIYKNFKSHFLPLTVVQLEDLLFSEFHLQNLKEKYSNLNFSEVSSLIEQKLDLTLKQVVSSPSISEYQIARKTKKGEPFQESRP